MSDVARDPEGLLALYRDMARIRAFETVVERDFLAGKMPGFAHVSSGQEAVPVGVCAALNDADYVTSTHRGHGHCLAKGCDPNRMMAELYGRATGLSSGKGGSMHMADLSKGFLGTDGIVGAGLPLACGAALAAKLRGDGRVAACFIGDGATDIGTFAESLNLASLWSLPVVFVVENNLYAEAMPQAAHQRVENIAERVQGYGLPGLIIDGMDVVAVANAARAAIDGARRGEGPTLLECKTYRYGGHFVGDPAGYRTAEEVAEYRRRDPIDRLKSELIDRRGHSPDDLDAITQAATHEMEQAVAFATASLLPRRDEVVTDVYV